MLIVIAEAEAVIGRRGQMLRVAAALATATKSAGGCRLCGVPAEPAQEEAR